MVGGKSMNEGRATLRRRPKARCLCGARYRWLVVLRLGDCWWWSEGQRRGRGDSNFARCSGDGRCGPWGLRSGGLKGRELWSFRGALVRCGSKLAYKGGVAESVEGLLDRDDTCEMAPIITVLDSPLRIRESRDARVSVGWHLEVHCQRSL